MYSYFKKVPRKEVHATIPNGIAGSLECTVPESNLKECRERPWTYVCEC